MKNLCSFGIDQYHKHNYCTYAVAKMMIQCMDHNMQTPATCLSREEQRSK